MTVIVMILAGLVGFAFALAVQMRLMISAVLRQALAAKFGGMPGDAAYRQAVVQAGNEAPQSPHALYLMSEHPLPLSHLRIARKATVWTLPVLFGLLVFLKFGLEAF